MNSDSAPHSGQTTSVWMATATLPEFSPLSTHERADVCIVGAGISGLSTAYLLLRAGKSVIVLDDGPIVSGETERTTAHLANAMDDRFTELERLHGREGAHLAAESHGAAIEMIERIVQEEQIDCDFERLDGYLFNVPGQPADLLDRELDAARRAGHVNARMVPRLPVETFYSGPAILFPRQAQFHPLKYLHGLATAVIQRGGRIFAHTHARKIEGGDNARVVTENGSVVSCGAIVVATNSPVNDRVTIHTKQMPYRTYVIGAVLPAGTVPKALYWDTADPYHYVRLQSLNAEQDVLIVGGEDHKTGHESEPEMRFRALETWTRRRFPKVGEIRYRWSGQVLEPVDGLAFIGRNPMDHPNVFIATGDSGQGMTHGTIAGMLISDLIVGRPNRWEKLYDPSRMKLSAAKEYVVEDTSMLSQYFDWLTAGDVEKDQNIAPGTGAVVRHGLTKVAVYRDPQGNFHECSAVCPHLGGIVAWNRAEKSWDCPVHGSRFDCHGHVMNGPAISNLEPVTEHAHRGGDDRHAA